MIRTSMRTVKAIVLQLQGGADQIEYLVWEAKS